MVPLTSLVVLQRHKRHSLYVDPHAERGVFICNRLGKVYFRINDFINNSHIHVFHLSFKSVIKTI